MDQNEDIAQEEMGEDMVNSLLDMQKILCLKMFEYGQEYAKKRNCG